MFSDASVYRMLDFLVIGFYLGVVVVLLVTVLVLLFELLILKIQRLKYEIAEQEEDNQEEDASPEDCKEEDLNLAEGIQKGDYRDDGAFTYEAFLENKKIPKGKNKKQSEANHGEKTFL